MKLAIVFTALVALASANNYHTCMKKSKKAVGAINAFCSKKTDMVVPTFFAKMGVGNPPDLLYRARIWANCKPAVWVPRKYCYSQMFEVCAKGGKDGTGMRKYGKKGCQQWQIM